MDWEKEGAFSVRISLKLEEVLQVLCREKLTALETSAVQLSSSLDLSTLHCPQRVLSSQKGGQDDP